MTEHSTPPASRTLRLMWPQWQGAGREVVSVLAPEFPIDVARRGYSMGTRVLEAILPPPDGPTAWVPVDSGDDGLEREDGVEAKRAVLASLENALSTLAAHDFDRVVTLGGECSVSVAPFSTLAAQYGDDLAVVWLDSHPDVGTPASEYSGYHAMAVAVLTGHGDPDLVGCLPATVSPAKVALAGLHSWTEDDFPNAARWGIRAFSAQELRADSASLVEWLRETGCSKLAIHLDVDVVDADEVVLGLGAERGGLTTADVRQVIAAVEATADVVGLTIAEYLPRQVIQVQRLLADLPLL
ncbi:arginase family protein [Agromyces sp. NPDC058484]|uniref:arginase family protein n=1 Tax=Agromyces sp. NPDC058484 TaxID=3346524 RepID=UPI0036551667